MSSLSRQALVVSAARLINQGLMVISPVILVRLLTVQDFGVYREFLLYATLVASIAGFSLPNSLLYFVGLQPEGAWGYVRRIVLACAVSSGLAVVVFALVDRLGPTPLVGELLLPCILYVLFYVNVDFWESLWLARRQSTAVFAYTAGRLVMRLLVVIGAASIRPDPGVIVWSLVCFEAVRLGVSTFWWRRLSRREGSAAPRSSWSEQLAFCVPSGIAVFVSTLNSSIGGVFVSRSLGEAALAQFVIAGYVTMVVSPLRNSVSDVMLPRMANLTTQDPNGWLPLWRRAVVLFAILLLPLALLLGRYAELFVTTLFSARYRDAIPVFQVYCASLLISCVDIAVALRAINKTRLMLVGNVIVLVLNLALVSVLVPALGATGAALALLGSQLVALSYLLVVTARAQGLRLAELLPLRDLSKVALAALVAASVILPSFWTEAMGIAGAVASSVLYLAVFVALANGLRVEEAGWLWRQATRRLGRSRPASP
ncbi:MAG: oligosaccharide flippase family protein [Steroidobacteraceae bacterium]|nr:oligosaccharide flippase family protein [Steroidobacteraceae bacterium]